MKDKTIDNNFVLVKIMIHGFGQEWLVMDKGQIKTKIMRKMLETYLYQIWKNKPNGNYSTWNLDLNVRKWPKSKFMKVIHTRSPCVNRRDNILQWNIITYKFLYHPVKDLTAETSLVIKIIVIIFHFSSSFINELENENVQHRGKRKKKTCGKFTDNGKFVKI